MIMATLPDGMEAYSDRDLGVTPGDYNRMIDFLERNGNYVVLTQQEYQGMQTPDVSQPNIPDFTGTRPPEDKPSRGRGRRLWEAIHGSQAKGPPEVNPGVYVRQSTPKEWIGPPRVQPHPAPSGYQSDASMKQMTSKELPKLPIFSGDDSSKCEEEYRVWSFEAKCLISDGVLDDHLILQAIRASLRGTARQVLIPLGERASSRDILAKLDTLFGNVSSAETVLQKFYTASQQDKESVTVYGCRLESLLQMAIQSGHVKSASRNDMLRSRFWTGLRDEKLKSQTRHMFDSINEFDTLLRRIRAVEQEISVGPRPQKAHQQSVQTDSDRKIQKMADQMDTLLKKLKLLEEKVDGVSSGATKGDSKQGGGGNGPGPGTGYGGHYPAGGWNRGGAGRGNPRGFGRRGTFNRPPRSSGGGRGTDTTGANGHPNV